MLSEKMITMDKLEFILNKDARDGYEFQKRRHDDWKENYELFRDKVIINRLTQRQSVNIPLMKQIIKTLLSKIDDFIDLVFINLSNDDQKELLYNLYWNDVVKVDNRLELKDKVDKKQVMLFGRSFEKLNVMNGKVKFYIVDPADMRVDRYVDSTDIDTAGYIIQDNIFETLSDLKANKMYNQTVVKKFEDFFSTEQGIVLQSENQEEFQKKNEAMQDLGDTYANNPLLGQTLVQMQEGFIKVYNPEIEESEIVFTLSGAIKVSGEEQRLILFADLLENVIDPNQNCPDHFWRNHYPFETWGEDIENRDFWNDAVADSVRPPNKVINSWFSQTVENRTMRNFGMNYYNSSTSGEDGAFIPQTFEPKAWGWYGVPGNPNDLIKAVQIPELIGNLDEINFVVQVAEKASAATAITQGVPEQRQITLGEVQLIAGNAMDRIQSMSLYYQQAWLSLGRKYIKLMEAMGNDIEAVRLFKVGRITGKTIFNKTINPNTWKDKLGYDCKVISKKDKSERDLDQMQKLYTIKTFMPDNQALQKIMQEKLLDIGNLSAEESRQIMDEQTNTSKSLGSVSPLPLTNVTSSPINKVAQPPTMATA